jgi:hypothetical protein
MLLSAILFLLTPMAFAMEVRGLFLLPFLGGALLLLRALYVRHSHQLSEPEPFWAIPAFVTMSIVMVCVAIFGPLWLQRLMYAFPALLLVPIGLGEVRRQIRIAPSHERNEDRDEIEALSHSGAEE